MLSPFLRKILFYGALFSFLSCAAPERSNIGRDGIPVGDKVLTIAGRMIGKPYRYQGETPAGFDCSGLVRYSYLAAGMDVPHATGELKEATRAVDYDELRKGDLVFFDRNGKKYGHVGLYAGDSRFIHAPRPGKSVRIDSLLNPYWKERFSGARRFN